MALTWNQKVMLFRVVKWLKCCVEFIDSFIGTKTDICLEGFKFGCLEKIELQGEERLNLGGK